MTALTAIARVFVYGAGLGALVGIVVTVWEEWSFYRRIKRGEWPHDATL